jgi:sporulation protein YlmC with PRC-barrel domain
MKAIMTGVAVAALISAAPALAAGERLQVAQAEPQAEQTQEELQNTTACPEGETVTAEGEPCPPDTAAAPAEEPAAGEETEAAETAPAEEPAAGEETEAAETTEPQEGTTEELTADEEATEGEATEEMATEDATEPEAETAAAEGERFIEEQGEEAILASEIVGLTVYNPEDEALGDVNDIVWSEETGIEAIVVGVGGFLGIGEKSVAVSYSEVEITTDENGNKQLRLAATQEELEAAPEFVTQAEKLAEIQAEQQQAAPPASGGGMAPAPAPVQ